MSMLSNLLFGKDRGPSANAQALQTSTTKRGKTADDLTSRYMTSDAAFDPGAAFKEYATGANAQFHTQLADELTGLRGSEASGGRLKSGFFDQDQGHVVTRLADTFQSDLNRHALDTAGMRQRQIEGEGAMAQGATQDYNDLLSGQVDRETANDNARRQQRSSFWNGLIQVAGPAVAAHI